MLFYILFCFFDFALYFIVAYFIQLDHLSSYFIVAYFIVLYRLALSFVVAYFIVFYRLSYCTLYVVRCTLYVVRCTLYVVRCTLDVVRLLYVAGLIGARNGAAVQAKRYGLVKTCAPCRQKATFAHFDSFLPFL